jgi:integrase
MASSRRLDGEGSIRARPDGRFEVRLSVAGSRISQYARDRESALSLLQELRGRHLAGALVLPSTLTFGEFLSEWLAAHGPSLRPSTLESYRQVLRHAEPLLSVNLSKLEARHILALYAQKHKAGVSGHRLAKLHMVMHKALKDGMRWGSVSRNPVAQVDVPRASTEHREAWSIEQTRRFLATCTEAGSQEGRLFAFLLFTGLRMGEALALTWPNVNFDDNTIRVVRSVTRVDAGFVEGPPKSSAGMRTVTFPVDGIALLQQQRVLNYERRLAAGAVWQGGERVFTTSKGTVLDRSFLMRCVRRLCTRAEVPVVRVHDLRSAHASLLVYSGVDVKSAQRRLGHSNVRLTLQVYARALPEADRQAAERLGNMLHG